MSLDNNFENKLLQSIKAQKLLPRPKLQFVLKNMALWLLAGLTLLLSSAAFSMILLMSHFGEWRLMRRMGRGPLDFVLYSMPLFWIVFLALFVATVIFYVKKTKRGYRYPVVLVIVLSVLASVSIGGIFSLAHFDRLFDDFVGRHAPFYDKVINPRIDFWSRPAEGRLFGMVVSKKNELEYLLVDRDQQEWDIYADDSAVFADKVQVGTPARVFGQVVSEKRFLVRDVAAMRPGKGFFDRPEHRRPPVMPLMMDKRPGEAGQDLLQLMEKYPEFKQSFIDNLIKDKDRIRRVIKRDPDFVNRLRDAGIDENTISQLLTDANNYSQ